MENIGSPAGPLLWFARLQPRAWWARAGLEVAKWLLLLVWALGFLWIWFPVFVILFVWDYASASDQRPAGPAIPSKP